MPTIWHSLRVSPPYMRAHTLKVYDKLRLFLIYPPPPPSLWFFFSYNSLHGLGKGDRTAFDGATPPVYRTTAEAEAGMLSRSKPEELPEDADKDPEGKL